MLGTHRQLKHKSVVEHGEEPMIRVLIAAALALGCFAPESTVVERGGEPPVHHFADGDPEMEAAIGAARASVDEMIERLETLRVEGAYISVKVPVPIADTVEHIWLEDLEVRDGQFRGTLGNVPVENGGASFGDPVNARASDISDWMVIRDGQLYGGFTLFVIRSRMDESQRQAFDSSLDFVMPQAPLTLRAQGMECPSEGTWSIVLALDIQKVLAFGKTEVGAPRLNVVPLVPDASRHLLAINESSREHASADRSIREWFAKKCPGVTVRDIQRRLPGEVRLEDMRMRTGGLGSPPQP